jgi:ubiquinol-cytochrome c reductase iron-sulfur subunit
MYVLQLKVHKFGFASAPSGAISAPNQERGRTPDLSFTLQSCGASVTKDQANLRVDSRIMATNIETSETAGIEDGVRRRDFINIAAISFAGVGAGAIVLPLINQMNPSADVLAESSIEVDVSAIAPGQAIIAIFRKQPLFIRHLTPAEIAAAEKVDVGSLRDPESLEQRTKAGNKQWMITMGVCTHLGCTPQGAGKGEVRGEFGGYFCPCHGSVYDTAARIRSGPAPKNLMVPEYAFKSPTVVEVG